MIDWQGIFSVSVTPFDRNGAVDEDSFKALLDSTIADAADGVIVAGSTGEFYAISQHERERLFNLAVDHVRGRIPVLAGVSDLRTDDIIRAMHAAKDAGCAGAMILPPIYAFASQREIVGFYRQIAKSCSLPIMLYNSPRRVGVALETQTVKQLADIESVVAVKDSSALIVQVADLVHEVGQKLRVFVGYETMIAPALAVGAVGVVAMAHQVAGRLVRTYYDAVLKGDRQIAEPLERDVYAIYRCFQSGSYYAAIKETMSQLGRPVGMPRSPLLPLSDDQKKVIAEIIAATGLSRWAQK